LTTRLDRFDAIAQMLAFWPILQAGCHKGLAHTGVGARYEYPFFPMILGEVAL
jgi:hypothetical protein